MSRVPLASSFVQAALTRRLRALADVRLAYLFGSHARGQARAESDIDVAVLLDGADEASPAAYGAAIRRLGGRLAGEIPAERLDIVLLNQAPPLLRHRALRDGRLLYARSDADRARFARWTIRDYQDMQPRLAEHRRRRLERLREGKPRGGSRDILEEARRIGRLLGAREALGG